MMGFAGAGSGMGVNSYEHDNCINKKLKLDEKVCSLRKLLELPQLNNRLFMLSERAR